MQQTMLSHIKPKTACEVGDCLKKHIHIYPTPWGVTRMCEEHFQKEREFIEHRRASK